MKVTGAQPGIFRGRTDFLDTSINTSCATYKKRAPQRETFFFFSPRYS